MEEGSLNADHTCKLKLDMQDWSCPICMDLLYKCMHTAMDPYQPSQCPMCRSSYQHFPKVCERLHSLLATAFLEQYALRASETKEMEQETGVESPDISSTWQPVCAPGPGSDGVPPFLCCDRPGCGKLLVEPVVLSCGHTVCSWPCALGADGSVSVAAALDKQQGQEQQALQKEQVHLLDQHKEQPQADLQQQAVQQQQGQQDMRSVQQREQRQEPSTSAAAAAATAAPHEAATEAAEAAEAPATAAAATEQGAAAQLAAPSAAQENTAADAAEAAEEALLCPACCTPIVCIPQCCLLLSNLAQQCCPQQHAARVLEVQESRAAAERMAASAGASSSHAAPPGAAGEPSGRSSASPSPSGFRGSGRPRGGSPRVPGLLEAVRNSAGNGTDTWRVLWQELLKHADTAYTWHGAGCDDCGVYPIMGRRYRCKDCPEAIGYDLCGPCYDGGLAGRGRFNQNHTAEHSMEKCEPRMSVADPVSGMINCLQALHPDLSAGQILRLLQLQFVRDGAPEPAAGADDGSDGHEEDLDSEEQREEDSDDDADMAAEWGDGQAVAVPLAAILPRDGRSDADVQAEEAGAAPVAMDVVHSEPASEQAIGVLPAEGATSVTEAANEAGAQQGRSSSRQPSTGGSCTLQ